MGKLAVMSDLHVDSNQLTNEDIDILMDVLKENQVNHIHLAGDTANTVSQLIEIVNLIECSGISATFNFGNHEMPSLQDIDLIENFQDKRFLNFKTKELTKDIVLLGVNGWYDYSFSLESDTKKIINAKNLYWYDRMINRETSDFEVTNRILINLERVLKKLEKQQKRVTLATHFVPRKEFIRYYTGRLARWNQINAFLGTEKLGQLVDSFDHVSHVVFGHTHRKFEEQMINGTIYTAKPFGYFYEWELTRDFMINNQLMTSFNPMKVRRILKHHQEEFDSFKRTHIKNEFTNSLTLIDY